MTKGLVRPVLIAVMFMSPLGLRAQPNQSPSFYPLPLHITSGRFTPAGVYFQMTFTRMNEPVTAIMNEILERETPRRVFVDILRAIRDDDFDAFAARVDHTDGTVVREVFDYFRKWITDWNDVLHDRTLRFSGLTLFVLDGGGLKVDKLPIPIIERHGKLVMSWQLLGHNIVQCTNYFLRAFQSSPVALAKQPKLPGSIEVSIGDPFDVGSQESARFLVTGSRMSYSILGFRDRPERIPDNVPRGALSVYKASYTALAAKDKAGYLSTMDERSRGGLKSQWEHMVDLNVLDEYVAARAPQTRIGAVITAGPVTIFFKQAGLHKFPTQPELVLEEPPGTFQRINVDGPLLSLLKWDRFLLPFEKALTLQEEK